MRRVVLLFNTIKFLKVRQLWGQLINRSRRKCHLRDQNRRFSLTKVDFSREPNVTGKFCFPLTFCFLNRTKCFEKEVDWDFLSFGKLWNYNLEYFDYLMENDISLDEKKMLIRDFYSFSIKKERELEPYPISLRTINIIRFSVQNNLFTEQYLNFVYQELKYLNGHCEYHLLGNHLLENAFALLLGGVFFDEKTWKLKAIDILKKELDEQILNDGAHFELSPMYHKIIFYRILELIDWYRNYKDNDESFLNYCLKKAELMRSWLENIQFHCGDIPLFNDSAKNIAYDSQFLLEYADSLKITSSKVSLGESGYRTFKNYNYEIKVDFAQLGSSYQPGHAHADTLSFILYYKGIPLFVEQGTSTYEIGVRRELERSTGAHNTVIVAGKNQSEVWGGFRVGNRAKTTILKDDLEIIEAQHDGYESLGIVHKRAYYFGNETLSIEDVLVGRTLSAQAVFHIHPRFSCIIAGNTVEIDGRVLCVFENCDGIHIESFDYAESYNKYQKAQRIVVTFTSSLRTVINFLN